MELKATQLQSSRTQLPYGPYSLDFCKPEKVVGTAENLGEILTGDVIKNSPYNIYMLEPGKCKVLCNPMTYNAASRKKFATRIDDEYTVNYILDNLPAATVVVAADENGNPRKGIHCMCVCVCVCVCVRFMRLRDSIEQTTKQNKNTNWDFRSDSNPTTTGSSTTTWP